MLIKTGFDITFSTEKATPMLIMLCIHPSRIDDIVDGEKIVAEPCVPIHFFQDSFGNFCGRLTAPAGGVRLWGSALVRDSGLLDAVELNAIQHPIEVLPDECLLYLMASRYCETDKLMDIAWSLFRDTPPGWARVQAICTFVHNHLTFGYEHASPTKSAHDAYLHKNGVCRDFAHLALTLCRCMNIPARYVTGYMGDIGIPLDGSPMDFSGWFEVYLSGKWHTCDARHNKQRIGRIMMGTGRDAADVALTTSFGRMKMSTFRVFTDEVMEVQSYQAAFQPPLPSMGSTGATQAGCCADIGLRAGGELAVELGRQRRVPSDVQLSTA
jgi:transglutaminase-like putative cysteine protease